MKNYISPFDGEEFTHGEHQCEMLSKMIEKNMTELEGSLLRDLRYINHRAEHHGGMRVENIKYLSDDEYLLEYSYDWYAYNSCANMDETGEIEDTVTFNVHNDGVISFNFIEPVERSTQDEF